MGLTRDDMLRAAREARIQRDKLTVPELGGDIYVRGMSGKERDEFEEGLRIRRGRKAGQSDLRNFRAKLAVKVIVNEDGQRILTDEDATVFGQLPAGVLDRIITRCSELSGLAEEEADDLGNASGNEGSVVPFSNSRSVSAG